MLIWTSLKAKPHHTITHHQEKKEDKDMHENINKNKDGIQSMDYICWTPYILLSLLQHSPKKILLKFTLEMELQ